MAVHPKSSRCNREKSSSRTYRSVLYWKCTDADESSRGLLTIGQYLQPTHNHYPVAAYIHPDQFESYKEIGLKKGFKKIESAPLVRSSYLAEKHLLLQKKVRHLEQL